MSKLAQHTPALISKTESRNWHRFRCKSHLTPGVLVRFLKTCTSGKLQHTNEQVLINGNSHHFNNTPLFIHGVASLASRLYNTEERKTTKKRNFYQTKTKQKMKTALFGCLESGIKGIQNHRVRKEIDLKLMFKYFIYTAAIQL